MAKSLVIVESPGKAKTINKFLGPGYTVKACMGHIMDLPEKSLGVDIEHDFEPEYVVVKGKTKVVKELKAAAKSSDALYLAPDLDREGEAIAWHLSTLLDKSGVPVHRVIFNEITARAIQEAFSNPGEIDRKKVNAQQARRVLDRLVGYQVSPLLWKVIKRGTSAGRVQSVALRLICEREDQIKAFVPREYWTIEALLATGSEAEPFAARLVEIDGRKAEIEDQTTADELVDELETQTYKLTKLEKRQRRRNPSPPFVTSTLQQEAARRLRFPVKRTMRIAQDLYEGLDIGEGERVGLITYMRTDSTRIASEAVDDARSFVDDEYGSSYLPKNAVQYRTKRKSQDAHEAIRPTSVLRTPQELSSHLTKEQLAVYELIWRRFVACQMGPAKYDMTTGTISAGRFTLRATGSILKFDGFLKVYADPPARDAAKGDRSRAKKTDRDKAEGETTRDQDRILPPLTEGATLELREVTPEKHMTQPPPRYTEASLVKELDAKGIGRPSTYAAIVSTILDRDYVEKENGKLMPTELGATVRDLLVNNFSDIFEVEFTAHMENDLDRVESGQEEWVDVVRNFYEPFRSTLDQVQSRVDDLKRSVQTETDVTCEKCGRPMVIKWGRNGQFLACSGFPECRSTKPLEEESAPEVRRACDLCGRSMVVRRGRYGRFLSCSGYPECKNAKPLGTGISCPEENCGGELVERRGKSGRVFYGCSRYPDCRFVTWDRPLGEPCPQCGTSALVEKTRRDGQTSVRCLRCGHKETP